MDEESLKALLKKLQNGDISLRDTINIIKKLPFEKIHNSHIDHHRHLRQGIPEVVFAKDKEIEDVVNIAQRIYEKSGQVLITRANRQIYDALAIEEAKFYRRSGTIVAGGNKNRTGLIVVVTAGTSDIRVAEEAAVTAQFLGSNVETIYDVGVAGIHRLVNYMGLLQRANVLIAVAGMEGALPTVVASFTDKVVIGVPTSSGYGTSFGGLTALFSMLNSCVPSVVVVNIDNGFGAACVAHKINLLSSKR
jgi:hypothetical protein